MSGDSWKRRIAVDCGSRIIANYQGESVSLKALSLLLFDTAHSSSVHRKQNDWLRILPLESQQPLMKIICDILMS